MRTKVAFFNRLSIRTRLIFLICTLLLITIVVYGLANYYSLKKASLLIGRDRVGSLTDQLGTALNKQLQNGLNEMRSITRRDTISAYVRSGGHLYGRQVLHLFDKLQKDSTWVALRLMDSQGAVLLKLDRPGHPLLPETALSGKDDRVGKMVLLDRAIYYPVLTSIADKLLERRLGYLLIWKTIRANPQSVAQLSQLIGSGAAFFVGNNDGSLWTNTVRQVPGLPVRTLPFNQIIAYRDASGGAMIAKVRPIENSEWLLAVALPEQALLQGMRPFLSGIVAIGILLLFIGIGMAWITSRNITRRLRQLTAWAVVAQEGHYTELPAVGPRQDEIGELSSAFETMVSSLHQAHSDLEAKVAERTAQLHELNKELEAFSYSISHDLRAPLRAVNGYAIMLREDYGSQLDEEGNRIIGTITDNARNMGKLIDDLLAFSRLGRKALSLTQVDMEEMAAGVARETATHTGGKSVLTIGTLPAARADHAMIRQVWVNLLSNAFKYSAKKERPEITVGAEEAGKETIYFVKDNGAGFDMKYSNKLFGVFQRLHGQEEFEGTGVGLALVKRILDRHHGRVWAEARPGEGATFFFCLPNQQPN